MKIPLVKLAWCEALQNLSLTIFLRGGKCEVTHLSTSRRNLSATSLSSVTTESVCTLPNIPPNPFQWAQRCSRYRRNAGRGFSSSSFTKTRNPPPSGKDLNVTYDGQSVAIWLCAGVNIPTGRSRDDSYKQVCESPAMFVDVINGSINILDNFKSAG
jgi:hypothetical protein